jgi:hypothetical protein
MGPPRQVQRHEGTYEDLRGTEAVKVQTIVNEVVAGLPHRCEIALHSPQEEHGSDAGSRYARV